MKIAFLMGTVASIITYCNTALCGNWTQPRGLTISQTIGQNTSFLWSGTSLSGLSEKREYTQIKNKAFLHVRISIRIKSATPGFRFEPRIKYVDTEGVPLRGFSTFREALPRVNEPDVVDYEEYFKIPAKAAKAAMQIFLYGNRGNIELISCDMTPAAAKPKPEAMKYRHFKNPGRLSDAELDVHLAKMPVSRAEIVKCGEYNTIHVNGKEISSPIFFTTGYNHIPDMRYNMVRTYFDAGIKIFSTTVTLGLSRPKHTPSDIWQGSGKYDFAPVRQELRKVLREAPDAKILLNLIVSPYRGYGKQFPDELYRAADGQFGAFFHGYMRGTAPEALEPVKGSDDAFSPPSNCSAHFRNEAAKAIRDFCSAVSSFPEGKAVIAVYLNGGVDGQWFDQFNSAVTLTADYSPAAVKAFRNYLTMKYQGNQVLLKKAWREPTATFETATVPTHDELWRKDRNFHTLFQTASKCSDYCEFLGWNRAQQQIVWCDAVKAGSQGRWLAGSYYSNSGLRGFPQLGLQSIRYLLDAPSVELFVLIPNYLRNFYEPVHQGGFNGSLVRHGKLIITELDLRNGELPYWGHWGTNFWRSHNPAERFQTDASRFAASAIEKGGMFHIYDMEGGCFNSEASVEAWRKAASLLKHRTPRQVNRNHIGIVASEKFWCYQSFGRGRITAYSVRETPLHALYRAGVKYAVYLPEDLFKPDFDAPQILIFLDALSLNRQQTDTIRRRFASNGRVIVWMWQPGLFTDGGDKNISEAAGFHLQRAPKADNKPLFADGKSTDPLMKNIRGFLFPYSPPHLHGWGIAYGLADTQAVPLATYYGTDIPGMAVRRTRDYTEIWCGAPGSLTPQFCRNLAKEAQVPVFLESNDFSGTGSGILYVSALSPGNKTISLPEGITRCTSLTGQKFLQMGNKVSVHLETGELLILKLQTENTPQ